MHSRLLMLRIRHWHRYAILLLIADGRAISAVLSTPEHPVRVKDAKNPHKVRNPKKRLNREFKQHRGIPYSDLQHALRILKAMPDKAKLEPIPTFDRFIGKLR